MFAIELEDGGFTVVEIIGWSDEIEVGEVVSGELRSHGRERLFNVTKSSTVDVYIQAYDSTLDNVRTLIS